MIPSDNEIGLIGWLESKRISLPLKGVECDFRVSGNVADVRMRQLFYHDGESAIDCTYTFPLPADAAVFRCEMQVNDRLIRAEVREEGEEKGAVNPRRSAHLVVGTRGVAVASLA